jgi:hypothetical protein
MIVTIAIIILIVNMHHFVISEVTKLEASLPLKQNPRSFGLGSDQSLP